MTRTLQEERLYSVADYREALIDLLPRGPYWQAQLADRQSDLNSWLNWRATKLKAENDAITDMLKEGLPHRAQRTLRHWETTARLSGASKSTAQRQEILRRWRNGQLADWENFQSIASGYGMKLLRIEQVHPPFTTHRHINAPLNSRKDGNVRRFVMEPATQPVRPASYRKGFRLCDSIHKPIFGPNDWAHYAPMASAKVNAELQAITPLPCIAHAFYV